MACQWLLTAGTGQKILFYNFVTNTACGDNLRVYDGRPYLSLRLHCYQRETKVVLIQIGNMVFKFLKFANQKKFRSKNYF